MCLIFICQVEQFVPAFGLFGNKTDLFMLRSLLRNRQFTDLGAQSKGFYLTICLSCKKKFPSAHSQISFERVLISEVWIWMFPSNFPVRSSWKSPKQFNFRQKWQTSCSKITSITFKFISSQDDLSIWLFGNCLNHMILKLLKKN